MTQPAKENSSMSWLKQNWIKILMIFIGIFLAMGIIKSLTALFNGPFGNGVADVLGTAANIINGAVNGCTSQADCSIPTNEKNCVSSSGCSWQPASTTPGPPPKPVPATCFSKTGRKPGNGNFFSTSCLLGMGFLAYLASILVLPLLRGLVMLGGGVKDVVKNAARLRGSTLGEELKETTNKSLSASDRAIKELKDDKKIEVNEEVERATASMTSHRVAYNQERSAAEGASGLSDHERAVEQSRAWDRLTKNLEAEQEANREAFDPATSDAIDNAAGEAEPVAEPPKPPPVVEGFICCY